MVPFVAVERLETLVQRYHDILEQTMITATCRRLGIDASWDKAGELVAEFMKALKTSQVGFDEACFDWYGGEAAHQRAKTSARALIYQARDFAKAADMLSHLRLPTQKRNQIIFIFRMIIRCICGLIRLNLYGSRLHKQMTGHGLTTHWHKFIPCLMPMGYASRLLTGYYYLL